MKKVEGDHDHNDFGEISGPERWANIAIKCRKLAYQVGGFVTHKLDMGE